MTIAVPNPPGLPLPFDYSILIANLGMSVVVPAPDSAEAFAVSDTSSALKARSAKGTSRSYPSLQAQTSVRVDVAQPVGRPQRRASTREVDTAFTELANERADEISEGRDHDRLVDDRHVGRLDAAWDEGLLAVVQRPV